MKTALLGSMATIFSGFSGCVIPTPLREEGQGQTFSPVILDGDPPFATDGYLPRTTGDTIAFGVTAEDDTPMSTLRATLLFGRTGSKPMVTPAVIPLAPDRNNPNQWSGRAAAIQWCVFLGLGPSIVYVYVTDSGFPMSGDIADLNAGHYAFRNWVVDCK